MPCSGISSLGSWLTLQLSKATMVCVTSITWLSFCGSLLSGEQLTVVRQNVVCDSFFLFSLWFPWSHLSQPSIGLTIWDSEPVVNVNLKVNSYGPMVNKGPSKCVFSDCRRLFFGGIFLDTFISATESEWHRPSPLLRITPPPNTL